MTTKALAIAAVLALPTAATAATYDFSYTYDGSNFVLDAGSDTPLGTNLAVGDVMNIELKAGANLAWTVLNSFTQVLDGSFYILESGVRTANIDFTTSLDGVVVSQQMDTNVRQSTVHLGGQGLNYSAGNTFDRWFVTHTLLSSDSTDNTINNNNIAFWGTFANSQNIDFIEAPDSAAVPLPASLPLLLGALGFAGFMGRRKAA